MYVIIILEFQSARWGDGSWPIRRKGKVLAHWTHLVMVGSCRIFVCTYQMIYMEYIGILWNTV